MRRNRARHYRPLDPDEIMPLHWVRPGDILRRRMGFGLPFHYGINCGVPGDNVVVHNNKAGGVHGTSFEDFSAGRPVSLAARPDSWYDTATWIARAWKRKGTPYNVVTFNCESLVREAQTGRAFSWQVLVVVMIVVLGVVGFGLAAHR